MSSLELVRAAFREMNDLPYMEGVTVDMAFARTEAGRHLMLLADAMDLALADVMAGDVLPERADAATHRE